MTEDAQAAVRAAYQRFFDGFNSRDAGTWTASLHFPHVRISPRGDPKVVASAARHVAAASWEAALASGWHHSEAAAPDIVHLGSDRAHVAGGWRRFDADGAVILENRVAYVITRCGGRWGIQARYGVDAGAEIDVHEDEAVALVEDYLDAFNERDWKRCADRMSYPTFLIDPAMVRHWDRDATFRETLADGPWHFITEKRARAVHGGARAVTVALDVVLDGGDRTQQALFFVTRRAGRWGIQARSILEH